METEAFQIVFRKVVVGIVPENVFTLGFLSTLITLVGNVADFTGQNGERRKLVFPLFGSGNRFICRMSVDNDYFKVTNGLVRQVRK